MPNARPLTIDLLVKEAKAFAGVQSKTDEPALYGVDNGKTVGTHVEQKFREDLLKRYDFEAGNAAKGIDFPGLDVDMKVTSIRKPQSSCPFRSARQKIYGLGYHLLVFVYDKQDDSVRETSRLDIQHVVFVDQGRTGDFQTTTGLNAILENDGNTDDVMAFLIERNLPVDEIGARQLAEEIMTTPPMMGYLTISNALQWRLHYSRVIVESGQVDGIQRVR